MKRVTLVEFRRNAGKILRRVQGGESMILTSRGKPMVRLEPIAPAAADPGDPIYHLSEIAMKDGKSLSNREIDRAVYGL